MIIIYIIGICLLMPFIFAIVRGCIDGITGKEKYKHLYCQDIPDISETSENNDNNILEDEIVHFEILIERNKEIAAYLEKELDNTFDIKKRSIILSKLNTLDNKTFNYQKKIDKLLEKLE